MDESEEKRVPKVQSQQNDANMCWTSLPVADTHKRGSLGVYHQGKMAIHLEHRSGTLNVYGSQVWTSGRHACSVRLDLPGFFGQNEKKMIWLGVCPAADPCIKRDVGHMGSGWSLFPQDGAIFHGAKGKNSKFVFAPEVGKAFTSGDTLEVYYDADKKHLGFGHNGKALGVAFEDVSAPVRLVLSMEGAVVASLVSCATPEPCLLMIEERHTNVKFQGGGGSEELLSGDSGPRLMAMILKHML